MIEHACGTTVRAIISTLVMLYWAIGTQIRTEILNHQRAKYGSEILSTLSKESVADFGNGYSVPNLSRMIHDPPPNSLVSA